MLCFPSKKSAADISIYIVCCWQLFCQKNVCGLKSAGRENNKGDKRGIKRDNFFEYPISTIFSAGKKWFNAF